jgi:hypothetical protein
MERRAFMGASVATFLTASPAITSEEKESSSELYELRTYTVKLDKLINFESTLRKPTYPHWSV